MINRLRLEFVDNVYKVSGRPLTVRSVSRPNSLGHGAGVRTGMHLWIRYLGPRGSVLDQASAVPAIVPVTRQNSTSKANTSQLARSRK